MSAMDQVTRILFVIDGLDIGGAEQPILETPVICTHLPSLSELMEDGEHGSYVPERAPEALADAIEAPARDPERCRLMGATGRRKIEALFDSKTNVAVLDPLFRSTTDSFAGAPRPHWTSGAGLTAIKEAEE